MHEILMSVLTTFIKTEGNKSPSVSVGLDDDFELDIKCDFSRNSKYYIFI